MNLEEVTIKMLKESWSRDVQEEVAEYGSSTDGISTCGTVDAVIESILSLTENGFSETLLNNLINEIEKVSTEYVEVEFPHFVMNSNAVETYKIYETDEKGDNKKLFKTLTEEELEGTSKEREEAINKLMKSSGLSREEVLKIVDQIK